MLSADGMDVKERQTHSHREASRCLPYCWRPGRDDVKELLGLVPLSTKWYTEFGQPILTDPGGTVGTGPRTGRRSDSI